MKNKKIIYGISLILSICALTLPVRASEGAECGDSFAPEHSQALSDNVKVDSRLRELFFGGEKMANSSEMLVPGGSVFGIKMKQTHVTVTDSSAIPALSPGDVILSINGKEIHTVEDMRKIIEASGGSSVTLRAIHKGSEITIEARPSLIDGTYKLGLGLRDSASGIGTITFYDPKTGLFGGLGHGICDSETGEVISMESGEICGVILGGVHKGECGKPGELSGILKDKKLGTLNENNECGVFGILSDTTLLQSTSSIPIGKKSDIHEGEATILSTLKNGKCAEYKIEIYDIDRSSLGSKSFRIRTKDSTLAAISGGIVRGMSGSPIIQDGKLVGAVTHVMVANPTEGYGIFIENMLKAAQNQALPKAA